MLQERCTQFGITPCYDLIANEGTVHEPVFIYACTAGGYTGTGRGPSKKKAKHNAAKAVLEVIDGGRYTFLTDENEEDEAVTTVQGGGQHPVTQLQEECQRRSLRPPEYVFEVKHPGPQQTFVCNCNVAEFTEVSGLHKLFNCLRDVINDLMVVSRCRLVDRRRLLSVVPLRRC